MIKDVFGRELGVSFSSVNRWESGKSTPNLSTMKKIKDFCDSHNLDFNILEEKWTQSGKDK